METTAVLKQNSLCHRLCMLPVTEKFSVRNVAGLNQEAQGINCLLETVIDYLKTFWALFQVLFTTYELFTLCHAANDPCGLPMFVLLLRKVATTASVVFFFQDFTKDSKRFTCSSGWSGWMWKIYPAFCSSWRNREIRWERFCRGDNLIMITLPSITHQRIWWSCYQWSNFPTYSNFYKNFKMRLRGAFWNRG